MKRALNLVGASRRPVYLESMIAADISSLTTDKLPINWFDAVVVILIVAGLFRGRKHGMTKELLLVFKWVVLVVVSGLFYQPVGQIYIDSLRTGKTAGYVYGYLSLAIVIIGVFAILKRMFSHRMEGKSFFGGAEYYLGMLAGIVRYLCMLLALLALLNAPYYTTAEIQAHEAYVKRWFGGGMYSGNYFPDLNTIQTMVFKKSFSGPYIKDALNPLLVETVPSAAERQEQKPAKVNIQK